MGFSGGGSNVLKPHKHSSAVQDGSPLDMNNVTEATLSAGDVVYSDGAALQRLAIGSAADTLVVNGAATAPEWVAPTPAASTWTEIFTSYNEAEIDTGYVDCGIYRCVDVFIQGKLNSTAALEMQFYNPVGVLDTGSRYGTGGFHNGIFYANANQSSLQLTFNQTVLTGSGCTGMAFRILSAPDQSLVLSPGTTFSYWITKRENYDNMYVNGTGYMMDNAGPPAWPDFMYFNGCKMITNSWDSVNVSILGYGNNTS
jgi:hypothetical protein